VIEKELILVKGDEDDRIHNQINFVNNIVDAISNDSMSVDNRAEMLIAIISRLNSIHAILTLLVYLPDKLYIQSNHKCSTSARSIDDSQ